MTASEPDRLAGSRGASEADGYCVCDTLLDGGEAPDCGVREHCEKAGAARGKAGRCPWTVTDIYGVLWRCTLLAHEPGPGSLHAPVPVSDSPDEQHGIARLDSAACKCGGHMIHQPPQTPQKTEEQR